MISVLDRYKQWTHAVVGLVNATRRQDATQVRARYLLTATQRRELWNAAGMVVERGLAHATTGEMSQRLRDNRLAITTRHANLGRLTERDVVIGEVGNVAMPTAARYHTWHHAIYAATDASGVLLCQPPHAMALANLGRLPNRECADMFEAVGGIHLLEDTASLTAHAVTAHAIVIPQIGVLVWGSSAHDAFIRAEALEYAARVSVVAAIIMAQGIRTQNQASER